MTHQIELLQEKALTGFGLTGCLPSPAPPPPRPPRLASIGAAIGLAMSLCTAYLLSWLRWRGAKPHIENTVVLAVAYLSFYVANSPAHVSFWFLCFRGFVFVPLFSWLCFRGPHQLAVVFLLGGLELLRPRLLGARPCSRADWPTD